MRTKSYHVMRKGESIATTKSGNLALSILRDYGENGDEIRYDGQMLAILANGKIVSVSDLGKEANAEG